MRRWIAITAMMVSLTAVAQRPAFDSFEVATVKPVPADQGPGRFFKMDGSRWIATNFTLKNLIALAYDLNPKTISGGPEWMDSAKFNIEAVPAAGAVPVRAEQMRMLRALLVERFGLKFHRVEKEFAIYELTVAKGGAKLKAAAKPEDPPFLVGVVYPGKIEVPAKGVTMDDFVAMLQRATLDRPTVNKTGLAGKYDFTLDWAPDASQYGGEIPEAPEGTAVPPIFTAVQEQLGLKLTPTHGMVRAMVVDAAVKPEAS